MPPSPGLGVADSVNAEVRMYDRLFLEAQPDAGGKDFIEGLIPNSLKTVPAIVEPSLGHAHKDDKFSSNATATLLPTGWTTSWTSRCSIWRWG